MNELELLAKLFKNLSEEEKEELLELVDEKTKSENKTNTKNLFLDMDIQEDPKIVEVSKKLNKNKKKTAVSKRKAIKIVKIKCKNCNKEFQLPENYPNIDNFICCVK